MKDTNFLFDMSPHYAIVFREDKVDGEPASGGGTNPKWEAEHTIESSDGTGIVNFTFLNDNEFLGDANMDFASLLAMGAEGGGWIDMNDAGGKFQLTIISHESPAAEEEAPPDPAPPTPAPAPAQPQ